MEKAVIFFVISDHQQKQPQHEALTMRALNNQRTIVGVFAVEPHDSAMGFFHALDACMSQGATFLLVDSLKSLVFSRSELARVLERLVECQVTLEVGDSELRAPELKLFLQLLHQSEQRQRNVRSQNIKAALKTRAHQGQKLGGRKYGKTREELRVIKQIVKLYEQGKSLSTICVMLEHNKIATAHQKTWYPMTVKRLIDDYYRQAKNI